MLSRYLSSQGCNVGQFSDGGNPPDFILPVDGTVYSVEVTRLMEQKTILNKSNKPVTVSRRWQSQSFHRWMSEVRKKVAALHILDGEYRICLTGDLDGFRREPSLTSEVLRYIESTRFLGQSDYQVVWDNGSAAIDIAKVDCTGALVWGMVLATESMEDAHPIAAEILRVAILEKAKKVAGIITPIILLLHNTYPFANQQVYRDAFESMGHEPFCGVYVVEDDSCTALLDIAPVVSRQNATTDTVLEG